MTRAQKVARATRLRQQGHTLKQIGEMMGAARSTVSTWISDPDLSKQHARRRRYAQPCPSCGEPMDGSNGYKRSPQMCSFCQQWPLVAVIDAIRRWADAHGGIPPTMSDWSKSSPDHPYAGTVERRWGWNEMLLRAGFKLHCDRRPQTQEWVERQLRNGTPIREIASRLGVSDAAIRQRLHWRGLTIADLQSPPANKPDEGDKQ